jgi:hypothetical protein
MPYETCQPQTDLLSPSNCYCAINGSDPIDYYENFTGSSWCVKFAIGQTGPQGRRGLRGEGTMPQSRPLGALF